MASGRDAVKPISECKFCCIPPGRRGLLFLDHPKCGACGILMGPGHVEPDADAEFCSTCSCAGGEIRNLIAKQRAAAIR